MENSGVIKKKNRSIYVVLAAAVFGLMAVVFVYVGVRSYTGVVTILAASREIPAFTTISEDDLTEITIPKTYAQNKTNNKSLVVGRVTRTIIPKDAAIQQDFLAVKGEERNSLLATRLTDLKDGKLRAFTIPLDNITGCGGEIASGDLVDIIGAFNINLPAPTQMPRAGQYQQAQNQQQEKQNKEVISKVLAGQVMVIKPLKTGGTSGDSGGITGASASSGEMKGIVVAVEPQQAQEIMFALQAGKISVALNPYNPEEKASETTTTTVKAFLEKYAKDLLKK